MTDTPIEPVVEPAVVEYAVSVDEPVAPVVEVVEAPVVAAPVAPSGNGDPSGGAPSGAADAHAACDAADAADQAHDEPVVMVSTGTWPWRFVLPYFQAAAFTIASRGRVAGFSGAPDTLVRINAGLPKAQRYIAV